MPIPRALTINGWDIVSDAAGAIVVEVSKDTYANFPPDFSTDQISGTEDPTLVATNQKNQDISFSSFSGAISKGDVMGFNVLSVTTVKWVAITFRCTYP